MNEKGSLQLSNYEGPLDLLLSLVRDKKMDIFEINLAELANKYLEMINTLKETDLDLASEYLVMASTLLQIKTKMLLEDPSSMKQAEEEKSSLLNKLAEYQQFKLVGEKLREQEQERKKIYIKKASNYNEFQPAMDESRLDGYSDAAKLIQIMRRMFERLHIQTLRRAQIETFNLSPEDRRLEIIKMVTEGTDISFETIFDVPSINHFVVTMLTVLDMSRKQELIIEQNEQFGDIIIKKGDL